MVISSGVIGQAAKDLIQRVKNERSQSLSHAARSHRRRAGDLHPARRPLLLLHRQTGGVLRLPPRHRPNADDEMVHRAAAAGAGLVAAARRHRCSPPGPGRRRGIGSARSWSPASASSSPTNAANRSATSAAATGPKPGTTTTRRSSAPAPTDSTRSKPATTSAASPQATPRASPGFAGVFWIAYPRRRWLCLLIAVADGAEPDRDELPLRRRRHRGKLSRRHRRRVRRDVGGLEHRREAA